MNNNFGHPANTMELPFFIMYRNSKRIHMVWYFVHYSF